jgi:hypothetical protein
MLGVLQDPLLRRGAARLARDPGVLALYGFDPRLQGEGVNPASDMNLAILVGRRLKSTG